MNRNKTSKIIGDRQPGLDHTWAIHISHDVMSMIIGRDLGHNYPDAIKNPAIEQYFERVTNRLDVLGMSLYYGKRCWVCVRGSHSAGEGIAQDLIYNVDDFFNEAPHSETGV